MSTDIYRDSDGLEHPITDLLGKGEFRVAYSRRVTAVCEKLLPVLFGWSAFYVTAFVLLMIDLLIPITSFLFDAIVDFLEYILNLTDFITAAAKASLFIFPAAGIVIYPIITRGKKCRYRANYEEFTVFEKNNTEHICYADVLEVNYTPRQLFKRFEHGYDVEIVTKYKTIVFRYVFPRLNELVNTENLPFEIIRERTPSKEAER